MNRRELFQVVNLVAAANVAGTLSVLSGDATPAVAILEVDGRLTAEQAKLIKARYEAAFKNIPPLDRAKLILLDQGVRLTFFDADGEVCSKEVIREFARAYSVRDDHGE